MRVVLAEDLFLLRDGLIRLLEAYGFTIAAAVDNGPDLVNALRDEKPDVAVVDVRLPPTQTDEGLQAALGAPREIIDSYVAAFLDMGVVERVSGGLVIPGAVFTSPEMMEAANEFYDRIMALVSALRAVGFSFGENAAA